MKPLKIKRPQENFNKFCSYDLFVGSDKIAKLKNGEEKSVKTNNCTLKFSGVEVQRLT